MRGMDCAVERLARAIALREKILVYGDYDVDGMTGTAILWLCLKLLGAEASYYVPHRVDEGYGLNAEAIRTLAADIGAQLGCGAYCEQLRRTAIGEYNVEQAEKIEK